MYFASVDIGGTQTRVACVDKDGVLIDKEAFSTDVDNPINNIHMIHKVILGFNKKITGVGMSCPGPLNLSEGIILMPPNLPGWHFFKIKKESSKIFGLPVIIENDANLAAFAESQIGAGKDYKIIQYLTISTGVGAGLIINNEIFTGAHGYAQEIFNSILWKDGPHQGLLNKGALESISSGTAIVKRAKDKGLEVENAGNVNDLANEGNAQALIIMNDAKEYLANMIAIMIGMIDPDLVVLGGGVAINIENFASDIEKLVKEKVYEVQRNNVLVKEATLGDDCGLIGGALYAHQKLKINIK